MERKTRRTVIDIAQHQSTIDFDEAELSPPFIFPEYQKELLARRYAADAIDIAIVATIYLIFVGVTFLQMPEPTLDKRTAGVYIAGLLVLTGVYFLLFMLSTSQTPGMKLKNLAAVTREGFPLDPRSAFMRGAGYFISIAPLMLGFIWALIDPEHLTWADKVSGTFLKRI
jgi:uncharacterized RDD family membrane protein YckC